MFKFFTQKEWFLWSILGSVFIIIATWYQVQLDVKINEWFGEFYDTLQKALTTPNSVSETEFIGYLITFAKIAALWILIAVFTGFFTSHWVFRWRTSMANYYHDQWLKARLTEGASQRVQEDTLKFARIMEGLGTNLLDSLMTLVAFTPILWELSKQIDKLPWIGQVDHALVWVAIISALGGTILLAAVGIKLPGIEYDIQKEEAGYRKELVHGEDDPIRAAPPSIGQLYNRVRGIHYKSYFHYLYFNTVKWSYFQGMVIVPYLALAPTIVTGAITLGFVQQITRAFGRVESSLQYLVKSWSTIVELISVWKRLKEFESKLESNKSEIYTENIVMSLDKNLISIFENITSKAALASYSLVGKKDKIAADKAAVDTMRRLLNKIDIKGRIVIGEGELDKSPMLYIGEEVGTGKGIEIDIAVDPLEGTNLAANNLPGALSVIAISEKNNLFHSPETYMDKIAVGNKVPNDAIDLDYKLEKNIKNLADCKNKNISDITACILDRPRHKQILDELKKLKVNLKLISDGDIAGALLVTDEKYNVDIFLGIGGGPEGVLAASALDAYNCNFQGRLIFKEENEILRAKKMGIQDLNKKYKLNEIVSGDSIFCATGITPGELVNGIFIKDNIYTSETLVTHKNSNFKKVIQRSEEIIS